MSIQGFFAMLQGQNQSVTSLGRSLATRLGVPYVAERESEKLLGHCYRDASREEALKQGLFPTRRFKKRCDGSILETDDWPSPLREFDQLTAEVWTRDNWPDNVNDVAGALGRCTTGITAVYYHRPSMCLVVIGASGEKVGIRSTAFRLLESQAAVEKMLGEFKKVECLHEC